MSDAAHPELIIVKRHDEEEHEHHSSAWKVAHADFMTAMMAFFLIMWLINVTDEEVRKGISAYFNPIRLSEGHTDLKGLAKPTTEPQDTKSKAKPEQKEVPPEVFNPMKLSEGHGDTEQLTEDEGESSEESADDSAAAMAEASPAAGASAAAAAGKAADPHGNDDSPTEAAAAAHGPLTAGGGNVEKEVELAVFQDPYAALAKLADEYSAEMAATADIIVGDPRMQGIAGGDIDRDPFDPVYWQLSPLPPAQTNNPGAQDKRAALDSQAEIDAIAPLPATKASDAPVPEPAEEADPEVEATLPATLDELIIESRTLPEDAVSETVQPDPVANDESPEVATRPAEPASPAVITAEQETPDAQGELQQPHEPHEQVPPSQTDPAAVDAEPSRRVVALSETIEAEIGDAMRATIVDGLAPRFSVTATGEGILIDLTDVAGFSMFGIGSAIPTGKVVVLMENIAAILHEKPGDIVVRGHTDGRPFRSETYDNWRLSAARAHMAYYMLVRGGVAEDRIVAIEGRADRALLNADNPLADENRRIEILLREVAR